MTGHPTMRRAMVCQAMRAETNTWMTGFATTTYAVAKGLLDGTLTEEQITDYPADDYPVDQSRRIADALGLSFSDGEAVYNGSGWRVDVDAEEIGTGVDALRAIPVADAGVNEEPGSEVWKFYTDSLEEHGVTIGDVREVMRGLSLADAAQLIVDAFASPLS